MWFGIEDIIQSSPSIHSLLFYIMHESLGIPACFFPSGEKEPEEVTAAAVARSRQSVFMSVYRTKLVGQCRLITVTWCKNPLLHARGLCVSVQGPNPDDSYRCKVELKGWHFWKKQGSKQFEVDGKTVDVVWDMKSAKFKGETEPQSDYYVAVVSEEEVVLLLGNLKKDAYRKTGCPPSLIDPILISRREHVFGKKRFSTRIRFCEKGRFYGISIQFINSDSDPELEIKIDGELVIQVKHLQWKFRGNESVKIGENGIEVYWDVHDLMFRSGPRHGLFIFKPISSPAAVAPPPSPNHGEVISHAPRDDGDDSRFSLFLYALKVE